MPIAVKHYKSGRPTVQEQQERQHLEEELAEVRDVSELRRLIESGKKALQQQSPEMTENANPAEQPKWVDAILSRLDAIEEDQRKAAEHREAELKQVKRREAKRKKAKRKDSSGGSSSGDGENEDEDVDYLNEFFDQDEIKGYKPDEEEEAKQRQKEKRRQEKEWRKQQEKEAQREEKKKANHSPRRDIYRDKDGNVFDPSKKFGIIQDNSLIYGNVTSSYPLNLPTDYYQKYIV